MQSLELEETPFIDLGLLRYVVCMMFKAVPVAKGEAFLVVAQRYLSLLDYLNQLELPIRLSSGLSSVAVLGSQFSPPFTMGPGSNRSPTTASASGCARRKEDVTVAPVRPPADQSAAPCMSVALQCHMLSI